MKKFYFFLAFFIVCSSSFSLDSKRFFAEELHAIELGNVAFVQGDDPIITLHGYGMDNKKHNKLATGWGIKWLGDYAIEKLKEPETTYFISVDLDEDSLLTLKFGCRIITHKASFDAQGIIKTDKSKPKKEREAYVIEKTSIGGLRSF